MQASKDELIKLHRRPEFTLSEKYGDLLSNLFITLCFSAGLPILYWFFFVNLCMAWIFDKFWILEVCQKVILPNITAAEALSQFRQLECH